ALFSDGMVLQQGVKCPVWGTAAPGEKVEVSYGEGGAAQATGTVADRDGKWLVTLPEHKAGGPYTLTIAGTNKVTLKDVYVGAVWVCSGQSNMEWSLANSANAKEAIANSKNPRIRLFRVAHRTAGKPVTDIPVTKDAGRWQECGPDAVKNFTAVG